MAKQSKSFSYDGYHVFIWKDKKGYYFEICGYNDANIADYVIYDSSDNEDDETYFYENDFEAEFSAKDYIDENLLD